METISGLNQRVINRQLHVNHVNLIGRISSSPRVVCLPNGKKVVNFTLATSQQALDSEGKMKKVTQYHRITGMGVWVALSEQFAHIGMSVAIEGRIISRFYNQSNGSKAMVSEIEINDFVIL
jgi:single-strand DNA-binding protein